MDELTTITGLLSYEEKCYKEPRFSIISKRFVDVNMKWTLEIMISPESVSFNESKNVCPVCLFRLASGMTSRRSVIFDENLWQSGAMDFYLNCLLELCLSGPSHPSKLQQLTAPVLALLQQTLWEK